jgi:ATPase family associated with various cellular activities (AAA)
MNAPEARLRDTDAKPLSWSAMNRQWLIEAMAQLRCRLNGETSEAPSTPKGFVPALVHCASAFGLSSFEADLLLLVAGVELDQGLRSAVSKLNGDRSSRVNFDFALTHLPDAHWDAISPDAPLRRLFILEQEVSDHLTQGFLRLDERMLHYISCVDVDDPVLRGIASVLPPASFVPDKAWAEQAALAAAQGLAVLLPGSKLDPAIRMECAGTIASAGRRAALWIDTRSLPGDAVQLDRLGRLISREARLTAVLPVFDTQDERPDASAMLATKLECGFVWFGDVHGALGQRPSIRMNSPKNTAAQQDAALRAAWQQRAPRDLQKNEASLLALSKAAAQFRLGAQGREIVVARGLAAKADSRAAAIWDAAREAARLDLDGLAQRIDTRVTLDDVVLPSGPKSIIANIARHLKQRERVFVDWGFGAKHALGQGLVALFAGESGTGKTLAAEAIANAVDLDLYRVDLASVVSKWIGETEKNLKRLFDAAEASGAVLVFDEADALFGKRSEAKDSHDRYANIEVAYLLQRIEAYRGLAILTTNMKGALDRAFLRRIRFVVNFPMPNEEARADIWQRQFPKQAPLGEIDTISLARFALPGGSIRAIALNAAFKAADAGKDIDQDLLMSATREEFAKLERAIGQLAGKGEK